MLLNNLVLAVSLPLFLNNVVFAQKCTGQSCMIAALSGSTNEAFDDLVKDSKGGKGPSGSDGAGRRCITKYYKQLGLKAPTSLPPARREAVQARDIAVQEKRKTVENIKKRQGGSCKPNINLFARGTTEVGAMGSTVGPALSRSLGAKWHTEGVRYSADIAGDNCIGFPGGIKCVDQLAKVAQQCPESKFFLSGYSQGAMVARICAAFSKDEVKARIKGVVVFGDPFNGASIKGFPQEGIKTFCAAGDGVCKGQFVIGPAHLSYTAGASVSQAARWMNERAG